MSRFVYPARPSTAAPGNGEAMQAHRSVLPMTQPGDTTERAADGIADRAAATRAMPGNRFPGPGARSATDRDVVPSDGGLPVEPRVRAEMERSFGHDFSRVRVHSGQEASSMAQRMAARAYTFGHDIVLGSGESEQGLAGRLLAHELAHVVQYDASGSAMVARAPQPPSVPPPPPPVPAGSNFTAEEAALLRQARTMLQPKGSAIVGVLIPEGGEPYPLVSGGGQGFYTHIEGKATMRMREQGITRAKLIVELEPCQICDRSTYPGPDVPTGGVTGTATGKKIPLQTSKINTALPMGSRLTVVGPESTGIYEGVAAKVTPRTPAIPLVSDPHPDPQPAQSTASAKTTGPAPPAEVTTPKLPAATIAPTAPGETAAPKLPAETTAPKVPAGTTTPKLPSEVAVPKVASGFEALEGVSARGTGKIRRFAIGAAGAAVEGALNIALLLVAVIWELLVVPYLARLQREAEEKYRKVLEQQIQTYYDTYLASEVERNIRRLGGVIKVFEDGHKQPYVNVALTVHFDLSLVRRFLSGPGTPESILDLNFRSLEATSVTVGSTPVKEYAEPLKADNATLFFDDATEFSQVVHFSAIPPTYQELVNKYGAANVGTGCFIATACYGSALAPQVDVLRRFRDCVLIRRPAGRAFVAWYYRHSPPVATYLGRHRVARWLMRTCLVAPAVAVARVSEKFRRTGRQSFFSRMNVSSIDAR